MANVTISVDDGTILLVAEILRAERNQAQPDFDDANDAIVSALRRMAAENKEETHV